MKSRTASPGAEKVASPVVTAAIAGETERPLPANGKHPSELSAFLFALQAMRAGDFSVRMSGDYEGIAGKIADTFNEIVAANERMSKELERAGEVVGREGKTRHRVKLGLSSGSWSDMETSVNTLIE